MEQALHTELQQLVADLRKKEEETVYIIPDEIMSNVKRAKNLENFLHELFTLVIGSSEINMSNIVRREFGMKGELADRMEHWARHSKEQLEDALHDAIDRAEIRTGKQGVFFEGDANKQENTEALRLIKSIAHAVVRCQLNPRFAGPDAYVEILDHTLQFYALPHTYPEGNTVNYRNLISSDRLAAMSGNDEIITAALKARAREWYQNSKLTFLESREEYHTHEQVHSYLYLLTEEQLERLRNDFIKYISEEFKTLKRKPVLHRAEYLLRMLETVLSWRVYK